MITPTTMFVIYSKDNFEHQGFFVVRKWKVYPNTLEPIDPPIGLFETLPEARKSIPVQFIRIARDISDDPTIVESYI